MATVVDRLIVIIVVLERTSRLGWLWVGVVGASYATYSFATPTASVRACPTANNESYYSQRYSYERADKSIGPWLSPRVTIAKTVSTIGKKRKEAIPTTTLSIPIRMAWRMEKISQQAGKEKKQFASLAETPASLPSRLYQRAAWIYRRVRRRRYKTRTLSRTSAYSASFFAAAFASMMLLYVISTHFFGLAIGSWVQTSNAFGVSSSQPCTAFRVLWRDHCREWRRHFLVVFHLEVQLKRSPALDLVLVLPFNKDHGRC
jgi:hypothetical protein